MKRYAVRIAYPGDRFFGSQVQPGLRTVEGQVLQDLQLVTKQDAGSLDVRFSSRTDKGVSALGNVFALSTDMDIRTLLKAVTGTSYKDTAVEKGVVYAYTVAAVVGGIHF